MTTTARALLTAPGSTNPAAPGYLTTEFFVTVLGMLASMLGVVAGWIPAEWASVALTIQGGLYAISRGITKFGVAQALASSA